jgi:hypothetical protein
VRRHRGTVRAHTRRGDRAAAASRGWPRWRRAAAVAAARHTCNLCWGGLASAGVEGLMFFIPGHQLPPLLPVRGRGGMALGAQRSVWAEWCRAVWVDACGGLGPLTARQGWTAKARGSPAASVRTPQPRAPSASPATPRPPTLCRPGSSDSALCRCRSRGTAPPVAAARQTCRVHSAERTATACAGGKQCNCPPPAGAGS